MRWRMRVWRGKDDGHVIDEVRSAISFAIPND